MKKLFYLIAIFTVLNFSDSFAQTNANTKFAYAEVTVHIGAFNKFKSTSISFGTDYPVQVEKKEEITAKVNTFNNGADIKNYMNDQGWEYVDQQNMLFNDMVVIYTFRKAK